METSVIGPKKGDKPKKVYPRLRLEHEFFPEVKKHDVGKTYKIELEVKATGLSISRFQNDTEYDIIGYECGEVKKSDESNDEEDDRDGE